MTDGRGYEVPQVTVTTATVGQCTVITVAGELDLYTIEPVRDALEALLDGYPKIVVDLSGVSFMDSSGLNALVSIRRRLPEETLLYVAGARPQVARVFTLTRLDRLFPLFPTVDAATQ